MKYSDVARCGGVLQLRRALFTVTSHRKIECYIAGISNAFL
jgi:hypothetical protein